ncbi:hypothetical protein SARC_09387 [Sphaeroforma arctica JP610]|uniref:TLC domain-containing protein n=1 Tax=Sphaeroforma arctica JP610 TaxID=667725 RepID=A0A0L0FN58_9EUKA|nr:hypothetical protein SARC_09387 [Sphaeroforma arctica JP610]KNC78169.1 hypothetical protein SARC_09387 [Sphaeroforma arctica JP610]|eukprot:XP_014152071.1 hypothetical protein SARC_09387 [Sphaeroforma arctica JP610]
MVGGGYLYADIPSEGFVFPSDAVYSAAVVAFLSYVYILGLQSVPKTTKPHIHKDKLFAHAWANEVASLVNSVILAVWSIALFVCSYTHPTFTKAYTRSMVVWFAAYNVYDIIGCSMYHASLFRESPTLVLHHAVVLSGLVYSLHNTYFLWHMVLATLCEANSVVLHIKCLVRMRASRATTAAPPTLLGYDLRTHVLDPLMYITHVVFRFDTSFWLWWSSIPLGERDRHFDTSACPWFPMATLYLALNVLTSYYMVRGVLRRKDRAKEKEPKKVE